MSVQTREQEFHDALAATLSRESSAPRAPDDLELALLDRLGPLEGRTVLDLGCGAGDLTLMLANRGAKVVALDISSGMVDLARARLSGSRALTVEFLVAPAEATGLEDSSVDLVVGKWVLHHIDVDAAASEIERVLRPGGKGIFIENQATNKVLSMARTSLAGRFGIPRYGTDDEHPLGKQEYVSLAAPFDGLRMIFPDFCFFALFERQVFRHRYPRLTRMFRDLDRLLWERFPRLRPYSYHVIVELSKRRSVVAVTEGQ